MDAPYVQKMIQAKEFLAQKEVELALLDIKPSRKKETIIYYLLRWKAVLILMWILKK